MNSFSRITITVFAGLGIGAAAQAQTASNLLGTPLVASGNLINGAASAHAGIAPTVNQVSPSAEGVTDGVTNAIAAAGAGVSGSGSQVQANGLLVGRRSNGQPLVSAGANNPANQGTLVAAANGRRP